MNTLPPPPRWVQAYVLFLTLISLNTTVLGYTAPELLFVDVSLDFGNAAPITAFYATRNAAVTVLCGAALISRSTALVFSVLLVRLVIETIDLAFTVHYGIVDVPMGMLIGAWLAVFTVPQAVGVWHLRAVATPYWRTP